MVSLAVLCTCAPECGCSRQPLHGLQPQLAQPSLHDTATLIWSKKSHGNVSCCEAWRGKVTAAARSSTARCDCCVIHQKNACGRSCHCCREHHAMLLICIQHARLTYACQCLTEHK